MTLTEKERIKEFVESVKSIIPKTGLGIKQSLNGFSVSYDGYWTRYKADGYVERCMIREDLESDTLSECAKHCWKLLMFRGRPEDVEKTVDFLLPLLKQGDIKSFKHNGDRLFDAPLYTKYVIVIYTWGVKERDELKAKLHSIGFTSIPYRRGCKAFERKFGHWKTWFKDK